MARDECIVDPSREGTSLSGVVCIKCRKPITDHLAIRVYENGQRTHEHYYKCVPLPAREGTGVGEARYES